MDDIIKGQIQLENEIIDDLNVEAGMLDSLECKAETGRAFNTDERNLLLNMIKLCRVNNAQAQRESMGRLLRHWNDLATLEGNHD